jgi:dihydroxyacetone kinase
MSKFNLTTTMMSSKTLINSPATLVVEALDGLLLTHPELVRVGTTPDVKVIMRGDWDAKRADKVAIISGGGSGACVCGRLS